MDSLEETPNFQHRQEYLKGRTHFQKRLAVEAQQEADSSAGRKEDYHYRPHHAEATGQEDVEALLETHEKRHFRDPPKKTDEEKEKDK